MRRSASATSPRTLLAAVALAGGCDDRVASRIDPHTQWTDEVTVAGRPKLDVLWVIDNSTSMCEEQASLAESLDALTERLLETGADIQAAVVTTDMEDATHRGRFQRTHATDHALSCELPCLTDDACGGECLCGVPFFRRCRANSDCEAGKACKWAPNSLIRHCASTCTFAGPAHDPRSDKCGADTPSRPEGPTASSPRAPTTGTATAARANAACGRRTG